MKHKLRIEKKELNLDLCMDCVCIVYRSRVDCVWIAC